uniref:Elongation of very long chain fatty acids protein n=1 Tax=Timema monikensis TaxID=170555 RepID=A0A7R9HUQ3_9NEOP|nr:unnamed protein product [Timema monikensis]
MMSNLYMYAFKLVWLGSYRFYCEPVDYSDTPEAHWTVRLVWGYFMLKVLDLLDTVFFVLRKKNNQITFLHVYHHAGMVFGTWFGVKFIAGGHAVFLGLINSIVHSFMYTYYLLTNINPDYKKSIWWKKYITQLQMAQFLILLIQSLPVLFKEECNYPRSIGGLLVTQNFFMLVLFYDFYRKAYHPKKIAQS